jgi:hypothetical protein
MVLGNHDDIRGGSYNAVKGSICHRIARQHINLISTYGIEMVMDAVEDKASSFEDRELEEIGSSDVSCWIKDIEETLKRWKDREVWSKVSI